jgi:hypothetical protein
MITIASSPSSPSSDCHHHLLYLLITIASLRSFLFSPFSDYHRLIASSPHHLIASLQSFLSFPSADYHCHLLHFLIAITIFSIL